MPGFWVGRTKRSAVPAIARHLPELRAACRHEVWVVSVSLNELHVSTECSVTDGLRSGRGWRALARNPWVSFAPLSPAPATRSIKARVTEHWRSASITNRIWFCEMNFR